MCTAHQTDNFLGFFFVQDGRQAFGFLRADRVKGSFIELDLLNMVEEFFGRLLGVQFVAFFQR